jgi:hypothetical protein
MRSDNFFVILFNHAVVKKMVHQTFYNVRRVMLMDKLETWINYYAASDAKAAHATNPGSSEVASIIGRKGFTR